METCVDDALTHLSSMEKLPYLSISMNKQIKVFQSEFRFLRMFLLCFPQWDCDANLHVSLSSLVASTAEICEIEGTNSIGTIVFEKITEWDSVAAKVKDKIREFMGEIKKHRKHLISYSLKAEPFTRNETMERLDSLHVNINDLVKFPEFLPMKSQSETPKEITFLLGKLVEFIAMGGENFEESFSCEFNDHDRANKVARLTLLHWILEMEDEELGHLHIDLRQKSNPCNHEFTRLCFEVIKVLKLKRSDTLIFGEFISRFVDFFLENLMLILNDVQMVREGLILLITFLHDPPVNTDLSFILKHIYAVLDQASHVICFFGEANMDLTKEKMTLDDFQKSINEVKGEIEKLYFQIPHLSWSDFPRTNGLGYVESLFVYLEYLKETMNKNKKLVPFLKYQIFTIQEELLTLRPFLHEISTMQNEHKELKDFWEHIISLSYQADLAIRSSFFTDNPIWYNLTRLSFIAGKIKDIQCMAMRIKGSHSCRTEVALPLMASVDVLKAPTSTSIVEVVVGFRQEMEELTDRLECGTAQLDIVSIVGMGGIGKTTLANKLFNKPSIIYHFHKRAFCSVSQEYIKRIVLLDILSDVCVIDDKVHQMSDDDLALKLYQSLKGNKYLIVMDDIWDIHAWYELKSSFPDDNNGSRIIFTTRINNISLLAKSGSAPHVLPFLSIDESWELLQQRIFHKDPCPSHLCKVGKLIARKCQGLPLTIVVIAGLLARIERSLPKWNEVADTLSSFASKEGCKEIIKLSYKQLPEVLKSCFLYLGAFSKDKIIEAKRLKLLWVAEGFVLKSESSCLLKVAKKCLNDLSDRNLVNVIKRSCNGGIKSFGIHDIIRDFCRNEAQEEHYMCFINAHNNNFLMPNVCDHYRIYIETEWRTFVHAKPKGHTVHSLLCFFKAYRQKKSLKSFLLNFKLVQVLDLQGVEIVGEFPITITKLVHLRYLALQLLSTSSNVPSEISNLWNLETLLLLASHPEPETLSFEANQVYQAYPYMIRFPNDIWKMKRLRHVETNGALVDLDKATGVLSQLPNLETFTLLYIPSRKGGDEVLRRLPNVRKLSCLCGGWFDPRRECIWLPKLEILTMLESLKMINVDDGVHQVHHPYMFSFPSTLRKLTLEKFCLPWNELSVIIGKLPCLQVLVLDNESFSGKRWDVQVEEFPSIKSLTLKGLDIEEWEASTESFPFLEKLSVSFCFRLIQIPRCFGEVPTLKSISVDFCNKGVVDSAIQIQVDQLDSGNQSFEIVHSG